MDIYSDGDETDGIIVIIINVNDHRKVCINVMALEVTVSENPLKTFQG